MSRLNDELNYFAKRAEAERQRAAEASDARARHAHELLAEEYAAKASRGVANDVGDDLLNAAT